MSDSRFHPTLEEPSENIRLPHVKMVVARNRSLLKIYAAPRKQLLRNPDHVSALPTRRNLNMALKNNHGNPAALTVNDHTNRILIPHPSNPVKPTAQPTKSTLSQGHTPTFKLCLAYQLTYPLTHIPLWPSHKQLNNPQPWVYPHHQFHHVGNPLKTPTPNPIQPSNHKQFTNTVRNPKLGPIKRG